MLGGVAGDPIAVLEARLAGRRHERGLGRAYETMSTFGREECGREKYVKRFVGPIDVDSGKRNLLA